MSRARLSETYLVVNDQSKGNLELSSRDQARQYFVSRPQDFQWSTTRTEQGSCLLTIPVLVEGDSFGPAKQYLPGQVTFWKAHAETDAMGGESRNSIPSGLRKHETIGRQSPLSFISNSWPERGRLPEREQSQLVLDQVPLWTCKSSPFYRKKSRLERMT